VSIARIEGAYLGIDVGGTKVAAALVEDGRLAPVAVTPTAQGNEPLVAQLAEAIEAHRSVGLQAVGIGVPSAVEFATGRVRNTANLPFEDVPLRALLEERTGLPVYVENDANCAALAEAFDDDGELVSPHLVLLTVGTGLGGGFVLDGKLYRGATGAAAEVGHTLMGLDLRDGAPERPGAFPQAGSLESLAAGRALDRLALEAAESNPGGSLGRRLADAGRVTGHDAVELANEGDPDAGRAVRVLGERLGVGIANMINLFDPLEVVIGGGVSLAGEIILEPARRIAAQHTLPGVGSRTTIRLARHGPQAGVLGAALNAAQEHALRSGADATQGRVS